MPDREKVIKGLEHCNKDGYAKDICADCPYVDKNPSECIGQLMSDALALLKEQEGVKPKPTGVEPNYNCGACGLPITQGYPFCPWCGRKVKWDAD